VALVLDRLTAASITNATIDNNKWACWLQCQVNDVDVQTTSVGIYGASVTYRIDSANG
jgi:hypothetical protein